MNGLSYFDVKRIRAARTARLAVSLVVLVLSLVCLFALAVSDPSEYLGPVSAEVR